MPACIKIDERELEVVKSFKYLGQQVTNNGKCENEIKTRIGIAKSRFGELKDILTSQQIQPVTRIRILKCYVYSALLYGSETWTLNKTLEKRIEAFEMWTFRRMARISWTERKTNVEVCESLEVRPSLLETIKTRKIKYFGHLKRHVTIQSHIMEGRVSGKRKRGRPIRSWMDDIKAWTGLSAAECSIRARDRDDWRTVSRRPLPRR